MKNKYITIILQVCYKCVSLDGVLVCKVISFPVILKLNLSNDGELGLASLCFICRV